MQISKTYSLIDVYREQHANLSLRPTEIHKTADFSEKMNKTCVYLFHFIIMSKVTCLSLVFVSYYAYTKKERYFKCNYFTFLPS